MKSKTNGKILHLSSIFDWYADDFWDAGGVITFINRYVEKPFSEDIEIQFLSYDWSLNRSHR